MTRKMLKEERELRRYIGACIWTPGEIPNESESHARKLITSLVKSVQEDCVRMVYEIKKARPDGYSYGAVIIREGVCNELVAAIRGKNGR